MANIATQIDLLRTISSRFYVVNIELFIENAIYLTKKKNLQFKKLTLKGWLNDKKVPNISFIIHFVISAS